MAILFDLDGTLIDSAQDIINAINDLCKELGKPIVNPQLLKDNTSFGLDKLLPIGLGIDINTIDPKSLEGLKARFRYFYKRSKFTNSTLFPGVIELIDHLHNNHFKVGIVTNKSLELSTMISERVNLLNRIECLVAADMVINPKPSPEPVFLALEKLQDRAEDSLFIGDAEQDIIAGNAAGVKTVAALYGYIGDPILAKSWPANYFVDDPKEIWPLIYSLFNR
jgi:N-acetyl-D-muramate 6-phosphate phosphatase